jgi:hypothetical protein
LGLNYQPGDVAEREFFSLYLQCFAGRRTADQIAFARCDTYPAEVVHRLGQINSWLGQRLDDMVNTGISLSENVYRSSLPYELATWLNTDWALLLDLALRTVIVHASLTGGIEETVAKLDGLFSQELQSLEAEEDSQ